MSSHRTPLGSCPRCGERLACDALLATCERGGWPVVFAECPDCRSVVNPR